MKNGVIQNPMELFFKDKTKADYQVDCHNLIISPGFIDIQLNGKF